MKRALLIIYLIIISCTASGQENPAPLPPNYERIKTETRRWFGEYRYSRLEKRFARCDTAMTVDHFRCLYYGATLRSDTNYTLLHLGRQYRRLSDSLGQWHPTTQQAWWRLQMLTSAVWSSGNGSEETPFFVSCPDDERYMVYECRDFLPNPTIVVYPHEYSPSLKETQRRLLVQQGFMPDEQQADLFRQIAEEWYRDDSLLTLLLDTYDCPEAKLWAEIQVATRYCWSSDHLRASIDRHRAERVPLLADLYFLLAKEYYFQATERGCYQCFDLALDVCDSTLRLFPGSDGAERCRLLRERILQPEVLMHNDRQWSIVPMPASEWALTSLWHRNAKRVFIKVYDFADTTFQHPLHEWDMRVTRHDDHSWHGTYLYLPPMAEGHYLLRASADKKFTTWSELELVRSDRVLYCDDQGHGFVLDLITGEPVEGFPVEAREFETDSLLAATLTDSFGAFDFSHLYIEKELRIHAPYAGTDLGRETRLYRPDEDLTTRTFCDITVDGQKEDLYLHAGDTVRFRCALFSIYGPLPGVPHKIYLIPWGEDPVDSVELISDPHGMGHGFFVLPKDSVEYGIVDYKDFYGSTVVSTYPEPEHTLDYYNPDNDYDLRYSPFYIYERGTQHWDSLRFECHVNPAPWENGIEIGLTLERLQVPQEHLITPMMPKGEEHTLSEREFHRRFPLLAYDRLYNNPNSWEVDTLVFSTQRTSFSQVNRSAFALPPLPDGVYRATLTLLESKHQMTDTSRVTLYSGRMPFVDYPINAWIDTSSLLNVGDTLRLHLETWLPDQQAIVSVGFNASPMRSQRIFLSNNTMVLPIPIEQEGFVSIHVASACHGEMTAGTLYWFTGELGRTLQKHLNATSYHENMTSHLTPPYWRDFRHSIHRQPIDYPLRRHPQPNIWDYLGVEPPHWVEFYDPPHYLSWRVLSNYKRLHNSNSTPSH